MEHEEDSAVTLRRTLKERCPQGATLIIRECGRTGYDRSYKVYTVLTDANRQIQRLDLLNPALLALGIFERDTLDINHISVPGADVNHAQHLRETIAAELYGDMSALTYEEI